LFRKNNVGHSKSECAAKTAKTFNKKCNIEPFKLRMDPESRKYFNDDFWNKQAFIVNAVDNVKARLFIDGRCVWYKKALFESGTLGTKCNS
jgi:ubiquitin-activating enzyme E1